MDGSAVPSGQCGGRVDAVRCSQCCRAAHSGAGGRPAFSRDRARGKGGDPPPVTAPRRRSLARSFDRAGSDGVGPLTTSPEARTCCGTPLLTLPSPRRQTLTTRPLPSGRCAEPGTASRASLGLAPFARSPIQWPLPLSIYLSLRIRPGPPRSGGEGEAEPRHVPIPLCAAHARARARPPRRRVQPLFFFVCVGGCVCAPRSDAWHNRLGIPWPGGIRPMALCLVRPLIFFFFYLLNFGPGHTWFPDFPRPAHFDILHRSGREGRGPLLHPDVRQRPHRLRRLR